MKGYYCGIDLGSKWVALCVMDAEGEVIFEDKIRMVRESIREVLGRWEDMFCILEASALSEQFSMFVEECGHRVAIIDPRHAKVITHCKKKTDKIDARKLAQIARTGWYNPVYRKSGIAREYRTLLGARQQMVKTQRAIGSSIRGLYHAHGVVLSEGSGMEFARNVAAALELLPEMIRPAIRDLLALWVKAFQSQKREYRKLQKISENHFDMKRFLSVPGVGGATAVAFYATIVDPGRFPAAEQVAAYIGLVPRIYQSGETEFKGRITKHGDPLLRYYLVEAANVLLTRVKTPSPLRDWGLKLREQKGLNKARVAVARKLSMLLYTLWRNQSVFIVKEKTSSLPMAA